MAGNDATDTENESRKKNGNDHMRGAETGKDDSKNAAGDPRKQNWFAFAFKKTAFTIWTTVMVVGVTLAFIASLLLL